MAEESGPFAALRFQKRFSFQALTVSLVLFVFVLYPLAPDRGLSRVVLDLAFSVILLAGLGVVSSFRRRWLLAAVGITVLFFFTRGAGYLHSHLVWEVVSHLTGGLFLAVTTLTILRGIFRMRQVTADTVWGAVAVYLMLGLIWFFAYAIVEASDPGAFRTADGDGATPVPASTLIYFSYVTLTTLGYGDVVPASPLASSLAILQALAGQLFLAVLVARLVGLHISHSHRESE